MTSSLWASGVSNHRRLVCLFNRFFGMPSQETSNPASLGLCEGKPPVTGGSPHKGPATRIPLSFDDVIMMNIAVNTNRCIPRPFWFYWKKYTTKIFWSQMRIDKKFRYIKTENIRTPGEWVKAIIPTQKNLRCPIPNSHHPSVVD